MSRSGVVYEIVDYRCPNDVDILVNGHQLIQNTKYDYFEAILDVTAKDVAIFKAIFELGLGKKRLAFNGQTKEIVAYRNANDLDILIDGTILLTGQSYRRFELY